MITIPSPKFDKIRVIICQGKEIKTDINVLANNSSFFKKFIYCNYKGPIILDDDIKPDVFIKAVKIINSHEVNIEADNIEEFCNIVLKFKFKRLYKTAYDYLQKNEIANEKIKNNFLKLINKKMTSVNFQNIDLYDSEDVLKLDEYDNISIIQEAKKLLSERDLVSQQLNDCEEEIKRIEGEINSIKEQNTAIRDQIANQKKNSQQIEIISPQSRVSEEYDEEEDSEMETIGVSNKHEIQLVEELNESENESDYESEEKIVSIGTKKPILEIEEEEEEEDENDDDIDLTKRNHNKIEQIEDSSDEEEDDSNSYLDLMKSKNNLEELASEPRGSLATRNQIYDTSTNSEKTDNSCSNIESSSDTPIGTIKTKPQSNHTKISTQAASTSELESQSSRASKLASSEEYNQYSENEYCDLNEPDINDVYVNKEYMWTVVHDAVSKGDLMGLQTHLMQNHNPNLLDIYDRSVFLIAALEGHSDVLEYLIDYSEKSDGMIYQLERPISTIDKFGNNVVTAYIKSKGTKNLRTLEKLYNDSKCQKFFEQTYEEGNSILHLAILYNSVVAAQFYLEKNLPKVKNDKNEDCYDLAFRSENHEKFVKLLSDYKYDEYILFRNESWKNINDFKILCLSPSTVKYFQQSIFAKAVDSLKKDHIFFILFKSTEIPGLDFSKDPSPPLQMLYERSLYDHLTDFVDYCGDSATLYYLMSLKNKRGENILLALAGAENKIFRKLIEGANASLISETNNFGTNLVQATAHYGIKQNLVYSIFFSRVNINYQDTRGYTALHFAAQNNHWTIIRYLVLECRANTKIKCVQRGHTPLMWSIFERKEKSFNELIKFSTDDDFKITDNDGNSVLAIATYRYSSKFPSFLGEVIRHDTDTGRLNLKHRTGLMLAVEKNNYEVVGLIASKYQSLFNPALKQTDENGQNLLHKAINNINMIKELLKFPEAKKLIRKPDKHGKTPISVVRDSQIAALLEA